MDPQINKSFSTELALGVDQHERPKPAFHNNVGR
jgi:hypothetical protein